MSTFHCIPAARVLQLAVIAGHKNDMPFGGDTHIVDSVATSYVMFALGLCEELHGVGYDFDRLSIAGIIDIAKDRGRFSEYKVGDEPILNTTRLLASEMQSLVYCRLAALIAQEIVIHLRKSR